jgi:hypothetical protein
VCEAEALAVETPRGAARQRLNGLEAQPLRVRRDVGVMRTMAAYDLTRMRT